MTREPCFHNLTASANIKTISLPGKDHTSSHTHNAEISSQDVNHDHTNGSTMWDDIAKNDHARATSRQQTLKQTLGSPPAVSLHLRHRRSSHTDQHSHGILQLSELLPHHLASGMREHSYTEQRAQHFSLPPEPT